MAIFGIGALFDNGKDRTDFFISKEFVCIGHEKDKVESESLFSLLAHIRIGDIIYIKSTPVKDLRINAIGIVTEDKIKKRNDESNEPLGQGPKVKWLWTGKPESLGKISDKNNVRRNALYEEFNPVVQKKIIELLPTKLLPTK